MLEPEKGRLGSVLRIWEHVRAVGSLHEASHHLSFVGQESKDFTYRLCRMKLFIHGLDANIQLGNSYFDDRHATLKADYLLANPPFSDGSKGEYGGRRSDRRQGFAADARRSADDSLAS
jgi:type I restriction enzyme M protein